MHSDPKKIRFIHDPRLGHVHNKLPHRPDHWHMNVSCEVTGHRPVSLEYVLDQRKRH